MTYSGRKEDGQRSMLTVLLHSLNWLVSARLCKVSLGDRIEKQNQDQVEKAGGGRQLCKWSVLDQDRSFVQNETLPSEIHRTLPCQCPDLQTLVFPICLVSVSTQVQGGHCYFPCIQTFKDIAPLLVTKLGIWVHISYSR